MQSTLVYTAETTRVRYFLDMLTEKRKPVMLVGGAGSGKSVLIGEKLNSLSDNFAITNVPFNFYTTSGTDLCKVHYFYSLSGYSINPIFTDFAAQQLILNS